MHQFVQKTARRTGGLGRAASIGNRHWSFLALVQAAAGPDVDAGGVGPGRRDFALQGIDQRPSSLAAVAAASARTDEDADGLAGRDNGLGAAGSFGLHRQVEPLGLAALPGPMIAPDPAAIPMPESMMVSVVEETGGSRLMPAALAAVR